MFLAAAALLNITCVLFYVTDVIFLGKALSKTRKVGGSLVITLPKEFVESQKIKEGEVVEVTVRKFRKEGFGVLKGVKSFTAEDELTTHE